MTTWPNGILAAVAVERVRTRAERERESRGRRCTAGTTATTSGWVCLGLSSFRLQGGCSQLCSAEPERVEAAASPSCSSSLSLPRLGLFRSSHHLELSQNRALYTSKPPLDLAASTSAGRCSRSPFPTSSSSPRLPSTRRRPFDQHALVHDTRHRASASHSPPSCPRRRCTTTRTRMTSSRRAASCTSRPPSSGQCSPRSASLSAGPSSLRPSARRSTSASLPIALTARGPRLTVPARARRLEIAPTLLTVFGTVS